MGNKNEIIFLHSQDKNIKSDFDWIKEFYHFLQGEIPEGMTCKKIQLTPEQANTVIWYLQEHLSLLPDKIEQCTNCLELYDSSSDGHYSELEGKNYCGGCMHIFETTDCCNCGEEIYYTENEFDLSLCDECLIKFIKQ